MIEGAERDTLAPFQTDTLGAYALLDGPRFLVEILNAGHFAFSDICAGAIFGTPDCAPGTISQDDAHHLALRYGLPFLMRYVGRTTRFNHLLKVRASARVSRRAGWRWRCRPLVDPPRRGIRWRARRARPPSPTRRRRSP